MNPIKLLNEKEKLNHEYWNLKDKAEHQYRIKKKEHDKWVGMMIKIKRIENRMIEIIREYKEK